MTKVGFKPNGRLIPTHFINDTSLSYAEKGVLASLYCDVEVDDTDIFNSLISKGYIEKSKKGEFIVKSIPKQPDGEIILIEEVPKKEKKPNLMTKCIDEIKNFTNDEALQNVLKQYLFLRLNPAKESRLYGNKLTFYKFTRLLDDLKNMRGNKIDIVNRSIKKEWAIFVDTASKDNTDSSTLTDSERNRLDRSVSF